MTVTVKKPDQKPRDYASPIGRHGEFYLQNVPAGEWPALVDDQGRQCTFSMRFPSSKERVVKMGTLACVLQ